ncbi:MAG: hypothetical protein PHG14_11170 [Desulfobacter postgatei]|uniref:hypothetical protein n=1 Tax=Desulfobacter postgatei TaxID=2293 RepID=UPI0023F28C79|nr:hypothetical protein [Desulfobacter postgatei]MDD4274274.1 hypothetical protein [Desulfobacter postgatei]
MEKEQAIKDFAEKNNLTEAEAALVYVDGDPEKTMLNFSTLKSVKTGKVRNADQIRNDDLAKQSNDLLAQADEALRAGDTYKSIHLRRMAHGIQVR